MALLVYLQLFVAGWSALVLLFFPGIISYSQIVFFVNIVFIITFLKWIIRKKGVLPRRTLGIYIILICTIILWQITPYIYMDTNDKFNSYFMVFFAQTIPAIISATMIGNDLNIQYGIKKITPIISILFTFLVINGALNPTSVTSGGYAINDYGLDYNSISYFAAYATGFALYYVIFFDEINWYSLFKLKIFKIIGYIIPFINLFCILIAGGRGGLILFIVVILTCILISIYKNKITVHRLIKSIVFTCLTIIVIFLIIVNAMKSNISSSGFNRIVEMIQNGNSSGRDILRRQAIDIFKDKPLVGHGVGSIFYELNIYSHNLITDALVEVGIIGCIILCFLIIFSIYKIAMLIKKDKTYSIWLILLLYGLVQSMFSGYYLGQLPLYFCIAFIITIKLKKSEGGKE